MSNVITTNNYTHRIENTKKNTSNLYCTIMNLQDMIKT